jgi:DinB superfamily
MSSASYDSSLTACRKDRPVRCLPLILLALLQAAPARAQAAPDLLADLERNRATVLAYIDAMPDSATGYRPTRGVRTFAEQFDHIVTTNLEVAAIAIRGLKAAPVLGDSTRYLHDKSALRRYADTTYDYLLSALREAPAARLRRPVAMYGQPPQPAGRLAQLTFEHSVWTLGQLVPYLRLNGVKPPEYKMPF